MTTGCSSDTPYRCITGECVEVSLCIILLFRIHHSVSLVSVMILLFSVPMGSVLHLWINASQHGYVDFQSLNVVVVVIVELIMSTQVYRSVRKYRYSLLLEGFPYSAPPSLPICVQISPVQFILSIVQWLWTVLKDTRIVLMALVLQVLVSIRTRVHLHDLSSVRMGRVCCLLRIANRVENVC